MTPKSLLHIGPSVYRIQNTTAGFNNGEWTEIRYDIDESVQPDIVGTMTDMSKIASASIDAIYSAHNIEHLYPHEVPVALSEFRRVLKPSGFVVLTCPDLKSVAKLIAEDKLDEMAYLSPAGPIAPLDILYGLRSSMGRGNLYMAHKTGFTGKTLMQASLTSGFESVIATHREHPCYDLWIVACKSNTSEEDLQTICKGHFPA